LFRTVFSSSEGIWSNNKEERWRNDMFRGRSEVKD
jgi:hypothetical protein